jgi:hypothetical protein
MQDHRETMHYLASLLQKQESVAFSDLLQVGELSGIL